MARPISAFTDDALGTSDTVDLAQRIARRQLSASEAVEAAIARAETVEGQLHGLAYEAFETARLNANLPREGFFAGVPTLIKDNADLRGEPTNQGSAAYAGAPARHNGAFVKRFLQTGVVPLGKSRMPEFGFNASTEFRVGEPCVNPWNPAYSAGASSGGSAAWVAAGVVPIAHANDGGGSIRIPAAACGLVGLKPSRGRTPSEAVVQALPVRVIHDGVLTRTVRDTAAFYREIEKVYRPRRMPRMGEVTGPAQRRLRIGVLSESPVGSVDGETQATLQATRDLLTRMGHRVDDVSSPVGQQFADDFTLYWAMLSFLMLSTGKQSLDKSFDASKTEPLTRGLYDDFIANRTKMPGVIHRLRKLPTLWNEHFAEYDVILSPTLSHTTPELGFLSPTVPADEHFERLRRYVAFTPLHNVTGDPALSLPMGRTSNGLPIGIQFAAGFGDERTLLELAFEVEQAQPWPLLSDLSHRSAPR